MSTPSWAAIKRALTGDPNDARLLHAQVAGLSRSMPLLYLTVLVAVWLIAAAHWPSDAPVGMTVVIPIAVTAFAGVRLTGWWIGLRQAKSETMPIAKARSTLRRANIVMVAQTGGLCAWIGYLYPYGDSSARQLTIAALTSAVFAVAVCLVHLPSEALGVLVISSGFVLIYFSQQGSAMLTALAIDVALTGAVVCTVVIGHFRTFAQMITAQHHSEELSAENRRLANLDPLTRLANRRAFFEDLDQATAGASDAEPIAVAIVDLDRFKAVNDLYGHRIGDSLLAEVSSRLRREATAPGWLAYRLGGDEFAFLIRSPGDESELIADARRLTAQLREPYTIDGAVIHVGTSLGLATYPHLAASAEQLYEHADYALYYSKTHGGVVTAFDQRHREKIARAAKLGQALSRANLDTELTVVFQPMVSLATGRPLGFEALARWNSPTLGAVSPAEFIPVAERSSLIADITKTGLQKALAATATWPADLHLSFNISARDLAATQQIDWLLSSVTASGVDPRRVDIEITETVFEQDLELIGKSTARLRELGFGISLDDFGTGFSSLTRLHSLPLTKIKIDRSFVTNIHSDPVGASIVSSLLVLANQMQLGCVIEGVETAEERDTLIRLGGTVAQGFLYAKPMPPDDIPEYLAGFRDQKAEAHTSVPRPA